MKKLTFDINKVKVIDLDGQMLNVQVGKTVGNVIYCKATTLEWDEIARAIYAGKKVEVTTAELEALERLLLAPETPIYLMVKKPLKDYFNTLKSN